MRILVLNAGSSSQKSALYDFQDFEPSHQPLQPLWSAEITWNSGTETADLCVENFYGTEYSVQFPNNDRQSGMRQMLQTLWSKPTQVIENASEIDAVGHRVVHGGTIESDALRIDAQVKATIASLIPLAPSHNPINLEGIELIETVLGANVQQFAVFDTAFHSQIPDAAATYPGPYDWVDLGIRRYGFHGISHAYCSDRILQLLDHERLGHKKEFKLITCHLGNGCSLAAIQDGISIDTTMGFTPLEGLMMGNRSGSVDPGILLYLMTEQGYDATTLDALLNQQSGLKGLSGISHDMRQVKEAMKTGNPRAKLAWNVYIHRIRSGIGAMLMSLNGLDVLVFTAGVGEHDSEVRSAVCQGLGFLGIFVDEEINQAGTGDRDIATQDSPVRIWVLQTKENWHIARSCWMAVKLTSTK